MKDGVEDGSMILFLFFFIYVEEREVDEGRMYVTQDTCYLKMYVQFNWEKINNSESEEIRFRSIRGRRWSRHRRFNQSIKTIRDNQVRVIPINLLCRFYNWTNTIRKRLIKSTNTRGCPIRLH